MNNRKAVFDLSLYNSAQLVQMTNDWLNRHLTRVKHSCDDHELTNHPEWLFESWIENGGAKAFEKMRAEFDKVCDEIENCVFGQQCELSTVVNRWTHCHFRTTLKGLCMQCEKLKKHLEEISI